MRCIPPDIVVLHITILVFIIISCRCLQHTQDAITLQAAAFYVYLFSFFYSRFVYFVSTCILLPNTVCRDTGGLDSFKLKCSFVHKKIRVLARASKE